MKTLDSNYKININITRLNYHRLDVFVCDCNGIARVNIKYLI
jgi:hypothetical protein